jgi:hypothetical protein
VNKAGTRWLFADQLGPHFLDQPGQPALLIESIRPRGPLDADAVEARCLSDVLAGVRDRGWVHHIPRLMVLGNYAMQRGRSPGRGTMLVRIPPGIGLFWPATSRIWRPITACGSRCGACAG